MLVQKKELGIEYRMFVPYALTERRMQNRVRGESTTVAVAERQENGARDPWADDDFMLAMREGGAGAVTDVTARGRVARRMRSYTTKDRAGTMVLFFMALFLALFLALILARSSALLPLYSASRITHVLHVRLRFVSFAGASNAPRLCVCTCVEGTSRTSPREGDVRKCVPPLHSARAGSRAGSRGDVTGEIVLLRIPERALPTTWLLKNIVSEPNPETRPCLFPRDSKVTLL